jgi:hypothetical protein
MRSFIVCNLLFITYAYEDSQIKEDKMAGECEHMGEMRNTQGGI